MDDFLKDIGKKLREWGKEFEKQTLRKLWSEIKNLIIPQSTTIEEAEKPGEKKFSFWFIIVIIIVLILIFSMFKKK